MGLKLQLAVVAEYMTRESIKRRWDERVLLLGCKIVLFGNLTVVKCLQFKQEFKSIWYIVNLTTM